MSVTDKDILDLMYPGIKSHEEVWSATIEDYRDIPGIYVIWKNGTNSFFSAEFLRNVIVTDDYSFLNGLGC